MRKFVLAVWRSPLVCAWRRDPVKRATILLYGAAAFHFIYAALRMFAGVLYRHSRLDAAALFYLLLAFNRVVLIRALHEKEDGAASEADEARAFRISGRLLLVTGAVVCLLVIDTALGNRLSAYPRYVVLVSAAYAVYALFSATTDVFHLYRVGSPLLSASKTVSLTGSAVSAFTFLTDLLFALEGALSSAIRNLFAIAGGATVLLVVLYFSGRMLRLSGKK